MDSDNTGEFDLIARFFAPLAAPDAYSLTDDAALLPAIPADHRWVVTKDAMVAGVHFLPDDPADLVARKLLRVNLSDLAGMGATPVGYALATAWPRGINVAYIGEFADGLNQDQQEYDVTLVGGDTVSTDGPLTLSLTAFGTVGPAGPMRRNGARPGDDIFVTGTIGDGVLGLRAAQGLLAHLKEADVAYLADRYHLPQPRCRLGAALPGLANAGMDVSDGLLADLGHMATASGVGMEISAQDVPVSTTAIRVLNNIGMDLNALFSGGDDYEIVFTASGEHLDGIVEIAQHTGVPITRIGSVVAGGGVRLDGAEVDLTAAGWRHF